MFHHEFWFHFMKLMLYLSSNAIIFASVTTVHGVSSTLQGMAVLAKFISWHGFAKSCMELKGPFALLYSSLLRIPQKFWRFIQKVLTFSTEKRSIDPFWHSLDSSKRHKFSCLKEWHWHRWKKLHTRPRLLLEIFFCSASKSSLFLVVSKVINYYKMALMLWVFHTCS